MASANAGITEVDASASARSGSGSKSRVLLTLMWDCALPQPSLLLWAQHCFGYSSKEVLLFKMLFSGNGCVIVALKSLRKFFLED